MTNQELAAKLKTLIPQIDEEISAVERTNAALREQASGKVEVPDEHLALLDGFVARLQRIRT